MKTKTIIAVLLASASLCTLKAQTNQIPDLMPAPVTEAVEFLSTPSTNWQVAAYGIVNTRNHDTGFGVGAFYKVTENFGAVLRLDYLGGTLTMPSGNFQIQKEFTIANKFTTTMFGFTGVAVPVSDENSDAVAGIFGIGFAIRIPETGQWYVPRNILIDWEKWTNVDGTQVRAGVSWKL